MGCGSTTCSARGRFGPGGWTHSRRGVRQERPRCWPAGVVVGKAPYRRGDSGMVRPQRPWLGRWVTQQIPPERIGVGGAGALVGTVDAPSSPPPPPSIYFFPQPSDSLSRIDLYF